VLYLAPPLAARFIRTVFPIREGHIAVSTPEFLTWWALFNLQVIYCRLPALEECLRLVPGLYSCWLRLWGARVGRLTYWAAGLRVLDRSFLHIGNDVVFGAGVRLNPHVLARNEHNQMELTLATVIIGDRAIIGGYSLLTAGSEVAADECTRAFLVSPPFGKWQDGRRISKTDNGG
jgi:acetyltransferase-like isoleucine patch superfamily enzyme